MHEKRESREGWVPYLVEGYRPGASVESLAEAARQVRVAVEQMAAEGMPLRYVRSTIIPSDESCLFFVEAASERFVRAAYVRAGVDFERISTAIPVDETYRMLGRERDADLEREALKPPKGLEEVMRQLVIRGRRLWKGNRP